MVLTFFWIFENILVTTPPQKSCDSRAPLGLRRPRGAATSHPHSSTTTCRRKERPSVPHLGEGEAWKSHSRERLAWPPAWRGILIVNNCKSRPAREQRIGCCSPVRCIAIRTAALLDCSTGWVRGLMLGGRWVVDGGSLAHGDGRVSSKNKTPPFVSCFIQGPQEPTNY